MNSLQAYHQLNADKKPFAQCYLDLLSHPPYVIVNHLPGTSLAISH